MTREKITDGVVVQFQEFDLLGEMGFIAVVSAGMLALQNRSQNIVVVLAIDSSAPS